MDKLERLGLITRLKQIQALCLADGSISKKITQLIEDL